MTGGDPTDAEVLNALRRVGRSGSVSVGNIRAQRDMGALNYSIEDVCDLLAECRDWELKKNEPHRDPDRPMDRIAVLEIQPEGEPVPFYVKVALELPGLENGDLISFHL